MAKETVAKDATAATPAPQQETQPKASGKKEKKESVYKISELAANARKLFNTRQECVVVALKAGGKMEYTTSEAKTIIEKFLKKEVK